jgi:hypothetical protein
VNDPHRYRVMDEPLPSRFARFALPPTLVFIVATLFQPWGFLLLAVNALALNGPFRNREILLSLAPLPLYFGALELLGSMLTAGFVSLTLGRYCFVLAVGITLVFGAFAYISEEKTFQLRRYLSQLRGYA